MGRITRPVMFMAMARAAAMRATCHRLNVGALVVFQNNPVSVGWNGAPAGAPHCAGNECPGIIPGNCGTLHAEANALRKAADIVEHYSEVDLYTTHSPCEECVDKIMRSGLRVRRLFFEFPYRNTDHLEKLRDPYAKGEPGISRLPKSTTEVFEVTPAGYVVEYFSRRVVELP